MGTNKLLGNFNSNSVFLITNETLSFCVPSVPTMSLSPGLQDAVLLLRTIDQGVRVGVQHMALDVVQVKRGHFSSTHHAEQPPGLCLVLHQKLLPEPGVQRIIQVALQSAG